MNRVQHSRLHMEPAETDVSGTVDFLYNRVNIVFPGALQGVYAFTSLYYFLTGCPVSGATLFAGDHGSVRVLWYSEGKNGETGLYSSITKDQGVTFGPRQLVATGGARGTPVLVDRRGGLAAIWQRVEDNSSRVLVTLWVGDAVVPPSFVVVTNAELPAATANTERLFVAYIGKSNAKAGQDVWLVSSSLNDGNQATD